ncbi:hypothetical protein GPJ56_004413 [Histomonas meleagridis]|uniref:uncharacterized protein n=1 Tax=Histomonas meleagridis TaxID=135588 RepID=UPI00355AAC25|nr:hypothetical protein GPJ56_004413 [Histomonas meleagridis]KAH0799943.1 hypothetical protein GO595_007055 [Histomonas meleagridis]
MKVVDSLLLVKFTVGDLPIILSSWPRPFNFVEEEEQMFVSSANPLTELKDGQVYSFNIPSMYCYSLFFTHDGTGYSLVLLSPYPFAFFFTTILNYVYNEFQKDDTPLEPLSRLSYLATIIKSIPDNINSSITVHFPFWDYETNITPDSFTYKDYDPTDYFTDEQCNEIWLSLFTNTPILFIAEDITSANDAVFSALSLLSPLQFCDEVCVWLTETDPRFVSIINGDSNIKIAATSCVYLGEATSFFKNVIQVPKRHPRSSEIREELQKKTKQIITMTNYELDHMVLAKDPYFEDTKQELDKQKLQKSLDYYKKFNLPCADDFVKWENSNTFKKWREIRPSKDPFREGLLNCDRKLLLQKKSKEELEVISKVIDEYRKKYKKDEHVMAVLRMHKREVKKLLNEKN